MYSSSFILDLWVDATDMALVELLFNVFIAPIMLIFLNAKLCLWRHLWSSMLFIIPMLIVLVAEIALGYLRWGIQTGNLYKPDSETLLVVQSEILWASIITFVGWFIICIIKSCNARDSVTQGKSKKSKGTVHLLDKHPRG